MISLPKIKIPKKQEKQVLVQDNSTDIFVLEVDKEEIKLGLYNQKDDRIVNVSNNFYTKSGINFETDINLDENVEFLQDQLKKIKELYPTKSKNLVIGISQRNIISFTTTVRIKRINSDTKITKKELDDFVAKIVANCKDEIVNDIPNINIELLNSDIIFTKVDGYITKQPEGMRGTTLEISIFVNFINSDFLEEVISFSNKIGLDLVTIASGIYAFNKSLENNLEANYLLIDIDSNTTNLGVVFAGELFFATYVSFGYKDLIEFVKQKFSVTLEQAEDILLGKSVDESMLKAKNEILDYFYELISVKLQSTKKVKVLPEQVRVIGKKAKNIDKQLMLKNLSPLNFKDDPTITTLNVSVFSFFDESVNKIPASSFIKNLALAKFALKILDK